MRTKTKKQPINKSPSFKLFLLYNLVLNMETVGFAFGPIVKWLFEELQFLVLGFIFSVLKVATCFSHTNTPQTCTLMMLFITDGYQSS